jgi:hypothetical protein
MKWIHSFGDEHRGFESIEVIGRGNREAGAGIRIEAQTKLYTQLVEQRRDI